MKDQANGRIRIIVFTALVMGLMFFFPLLFMLAWGLWGWWQGWALAAWFNLMLLANIAAMACLHPGLIRERLLPGRQGGGGADRLLRWIFALSALWLLAMPAAERFGWLGAALPGWVLALGGAMLAASFVFLLGASVANPFLSTVIRLQQDRGQRVISHGVYAVVRHPQYLGIILLLLGAPILAGSLPALLLGAAISAMLVRRIGPEEAMLLGGLPGYAEYCQKLRWRLLPGVW